MVWAVSRRPLLAEVRVKFKVTPCWICGVQNATGPLLSPRAWFWRLSVLFHQRSTLIYRPVAIVV